MLLEERLLTHRVRVVLYRVWEAGNERRVLIEIRVGDRARISATEGICVTDMLLGSDAFVSVSQTDTRVN